MTFAPRAESGTSLCEFILFSFPFIIITFLDRLDWRAGKRKEAVGDCNGNLLRSESLIKQWLLFSVCRRSFSGVSVRECPKADEKTQGKQEKKNHKNKNIPFAGHANERIM